MGLTGYYSKFIRGYAFISKPLTEFLKKDNFTGTEDSTKAFKVLKMAMTKAPILTLSNFNKTFEIETNASSIDIRAEL